jgi:alpha-beta hydrolase superfamily lysophospholipase
LDCSIVQRLVPKRLRAAAMHRAGAAAACSRHAGAAASRAAALRVLAAP